MLRATIKPVMQIVVVLSVIKLNVVALPRTTNIFFSKNILAPNIHDLLLKIKFKYSKEFAKLLKHQVLLKKSTSSTSERHKVFEKM
jgi:hypothetical protein